MKTGSLILVIALGLASIAFADGASDPGVAVIGLYDALAEGDGVTAVSLLSSGTIGELQIMIDAMRMTPDLAATELTGLGIDITEEELETITAEEFGGMFLSSPMISEIVSMIDISLGDIEITGDSALVEVVTSMMGESSSDYVNAVLEDDGWKVVEMGL